MMKRRKILSLILSLIMITGTILSPLGACVEAQAETDSAQYRLVLDVQQMTGSLPNLNTPQASFPFSYSNYNCMTNNPQMVATAGYTNVVTYCADADGYLRVDDLKVWIGGSDYTTTEREVEFAVVDHAGVILTNQGDVVVINSDNYMKSGLSVEALAVKKGESLHFVFHGNTGYANSPRCNAKIMYSADGETWTQKNSTGLLWASTNTNESAAQGVENFYYNYSTTYEKEAITQDSVGIAYKEMTGKLENKDGKILFPFSHSNYHCMTNVPEIIASNGFTNVVAYQMPSDGQIKLDALKVWIANPDLDTTERAFEFAVIDKTGKVLSNDGKIAVVNSTTSTVSNMTVDALELKEGERLYFVFHATAGSTNSFRCSANIMLSADGTEWSQASQQIREGEYILWPADTTVDTAEQGKDNFYYGYSEIYVTHEYTAPTPQEPVQTTIPGTATVPEANEDGYMPTYNINMELADMTASTVHSDFPLAMPDKAWDCMTNPVGNQIVSAGYANVITYKVQEAGTLLLKNMKAGISSDTGVVLFAVTDKEGNIIYPADQTFVVLNKDNKSIEGTFLQDYNVAVGDEIRFVFEGVEGTTTACWVRGIMVQYDSEGKETRLTSEDGGYIAPVSGKTDQGADGFHYQYAKSFENVQTGYVTPPAEDIIPGNATVPEANEDGYMPTYKINFEAENMVESTVHASFPLSMPGKEYDCMTNPTGNKIVSPGYMNITTYKVQEAGTLTLKNMTASTHVATTPDNVVLFAVTDKEGNILYPTDGTLAVLNAESNQVTGTFLQNYAVEPGNEINFIFEGVVGKTASCWLSGIMVQYDEAGNETRLTHESGYISPISGSTDQGADGFYYRYAKTFENVQTGYVTPPEPEVLPGNATVPVANELGWYPTYKINFEAENMVASTVHKNFPLSMPDKEYDCMTNPTGNKVVSPGYMNITTYVVQKSGTITLKNMTASTHVATTPDNVVLFAVTDKEGNILYPSDGTLAVLNQENAKLTGVFLKDYKVEKGDEINFIFQGVVGKTASCWISGIMVHYDTAGNETRLTHESGHISPISGSTAQGADGFYYRYAKTFENVQTGYAQPPAPEILPGYPTVPVANAQGLVPQYKINFEAADMVTSTVHKNFPLSMPDKEYDCMTNPIGNQIVSKGYANILTYTAQKTGKLTLKNMTAAISVTNAPENVVLFAITDKEGNVIYPADGTLAVLNKDNAAVTGTFLSNYEVKKGDEINFIFQGVEGETVACRVRGIMLYIDSEGKETRLTREDGGYIAPISGSTAQGADGFSYRYAKKFENVIIGYVAPKSKAVQWGEGIQVVVSNNPDDFVYTDTSTESETDDEEVDMIEIIKPEVQLRYKYIPWIIVAVSGVIFGTQWVVFFIKKRKGAKQNEENN